MYLRAVKGSCPGRQSRFSFPSCRWECQGSEDADPGPGHLTEKRQSTGMEDEDAGGGNKPDRLVEK